MTLLICNSRAPIVALRASGDVGGNPPKPLELDIGDGRDSVSIINPTGDVPVLLLPRVLQMGDSSGSLDATNGSLGGSGLIGGSEGLPDDVLAEQSSTAFLKDSAPTGTWCSLKE